jgi:hypothetical protein
MRSVVVVLALCPVVASADDGAVEQPIVDIHGFISQGFLKSSDNNYLVESERGSLEFTEVGINFSRSLTNQLRVGMQLFARDLGPVGDYTAKVDWAFLDYRYRDWLGFRAGRIKLPFGLYNEVADIDAAHPFALLPQSVYPARNRDFLLAQTGAELYGYHRFDEAGALEYRLYGGTIHADLEEEQAENATLTRFSIPYVVGGRLIYETPLDGLRIGASAQRLRLEADFLDNRDPMMPNRMTTIDVPANLFVVSVELNHENVWLAAEYSRWHTSVKSNDPILDMTPDTENVRAYAFGAYRVLPWLQPGAYYALQYPQLSNRDRPSGKLHDAAGTIRIDLNNHWLVKLELHHMRGTAGLEPRLNPGFTPDQLANRWLLFVAKTTVYF